LESTFVCLIRFPMNSQDLHLPNIQSVQVIHTGKTTAKGDAFHTKKFLFHKHLRTSGSAFYE